MTSVTVGSVGTHIAVVSDADTAVQMGSGDVPVLATPRVVAWLEAAAVDAVRGLPDELTSVGIHISVDHSAPTLVGAEVRTVAEVREVQGKRIEFDVRAFEDDQVIAGGTHTRVVVDRHRFLARAGLPPH
ncbi:MAG: thioesterase family protein [Acidimicrobiia bacterium]|nr:thioesterase family protein [Acidimicrobiia bacterium]MDH3398041.1 thioesterase family protein [Acidimicrobiia bacterium]